MSFTPSTTSTGSLSFWFAFLSLLTCAFIGQSAFLGFVGKQIFTPYLTWPLIVFFLLWQKSLPALALLIFISILSHAFYPLSIFTLFILYLFCFLQIFFIKKFFFSKSPQIFLILVFMLSFFWPYLVDGAYDFSVNDLSLSTTVFYFSKALSTVFLSFLLFPLLKKHL